MKLLLIKFENYIIKYSLMEFNKRYINFSHFYSIMGTELIDKLFSVIDPFEPNTKSVYYNFILSF